MKSPFRLTVFVTFFSSVWIYLFLLAVVSHEVTYINAFTITTTNNNVVTNNAARISTTSVSSSSSRLEMTSDYNSNSNNNGRRRQLNQNNNNNRKKKKSVRDRTPEEVQSLIRDIIQAVVEAGPRAGPQRTFQAYRAVTRTVQDFLPVGNAATGSPFGRRRRRNSNRATAGGGGEEFSVPKVLRKLFERMGATYVKLGQFIASSPTIFPKEYVIEFQKCLDSTEPIEWNIIKNVIEKELGGPISNTYSYVDPKPIASASIAQVHLAKLKNTNEEVVIKVQKPKIDECLKADLGFIYTAARIIEFIQPDWERTSLANIVGDIKSSMLEELDFEKEAKNTIEFRQFLQENNLLQQATAPKVFLEQSTKKILTLEKLDGISMLDENTISSVTKDPSVGTELIIRALNIWSMTVVNMPFFHADVHAGNLLLLNDGRIGFIDFGIVGRISPKVLDAINELSIALSIGDYEQMAQALCNMGATDEDVNIVKFGNDLQAVMTKVNNIQPDITVSATLNDDGVNAATANIGFDENEISNLLLELVDVTENNGLKLPREFGLIVKQSLYFDRYMKMLAPNVDVMADERIAIGGMSKNEVNEQLSAAAVNGSSSSSEGGEDNNQSKELVIDV